MLRASKSMLLLNKNLEFFPQFGVWDGNDGRKAVEAVLHSLMLHTGGHSDSVTSAMVGNCANYNT